MYLYISAWDCTEKCPKPSWDKLRYYPFHSQAGQILFTKKSLLPLCSLWFSKIRNIKLIYHACILGLQFVTPRQQYILYSTLITGYENQVWMTLVTHGRIDCKLTAESFDLLSSCPYNSEEHKEYLNNFSPNPSKIWPKLDKFLKILLFFFQSQIVISNWVISNQLQIVE